LKSLKRVADELLDMHTKMVAYELMGQCYTDIKEYTLALKCHKKQLEISWISNDENQELRAYEFIGKVYFYMGEIYKCKMYHDRSQFGIIEPKDSKIR
jgi:tetratricopeptide (TPR) repeat protein